MSESVADLANTVPCIEAEIPLSTLSTSGLRSLCIVGLDGAPLLLAVTEDVLMGVWFTIYPMLVGGPFLLPTGYALPSGNSVTVMRQPLAFSLEKKAMFSFENAAKRARWLRECILCICDRAQLA